MKYKIAIFDLDGTITDSGTGIINSIRYALEKYGLPVPEEKVLRCTVSTLASTARENHITKTALITIGNFLGKNYERSKLYDPEFSNGCREASR